MKRFTVPALILGMLLDLYRIDKADGNASRIAQDCGCFTLSGGKIYYAAGEPGEYEKRFHTMNCNDTATGRTTQVFRGSDHIYCIAVYGERIYYSADPHPELEYEFYSDLFSRNMDGSGRELVVEEPYAFCFYHDFIYYTSGGYGDGTPVFRCNLDGSEVYQLVDWMSISWDFEFHSDMILYCTDPDYDAKSLVIQNIETGEQTVFPGYNDFALMGQYAVAQGDTLDAIDMETGRVYRLTGQDDALSGSLFSGDGCAYFRTDAQDGSFTLYRLTIENGSAAIGMVAQAGEEI